MNIRELGSRLITGTSGDLTAGRLYEMKRLEWLFIGARWLWVFRGNR
ncbi:MAG: hypothetical protein P3T54_05595 [Dehalogenimonas sp.]|uniref:Uncharacterized protein n=1 Tax=Candidatus Dehalogenimonas loeffleri TaxID=3127115 RepID=A0ABZ2J562_9CHLR|nr:hypothetical protein [Dehalogenimonas sp.]